MKVLVFSAHYDDAVFSAGEYIANHTASVVTVFGGLPNGTKVLTSYDSKFAKTAEEAVAVRTAENLEALSILNASAFNLEYPDSQYDDERNEKAIYDEICKIIHSNHFDIVLGPVGLLHPDHVLLRELILRAFKEEKFKLLLYEDLPYRIIEPDLAYQVLNQIRDEYKIRFDQYPQRRLGEKMAAIISYASQIGGDINQFNLGVPERFWWVDGTN